MDLRYHLEGIRTIKQQTKCLHLELFSKLIRKNKRANMGAMMSDVNASSVCTVLKEAARGIVEKIETNLNTDAEVL